MQKTLYIIRGLPGSGKSTIASHLTQHHVASDDFPGLYEGGYQISLQKQSHEWCYQRVEEMLKQGHSLIAVHNTFTTKYYLRPYLELAKKYGYAAHVINSEDVMLPNGTSTESTHNVPAETIAGMRNGWEPMHEPERKGLDFAQLAAELIDIPYPDVIIADMDRTIKFTKTGKTFPQTPDDAVLNPTFVDEIRKLLPVSELFVISNQRGIFSDQKSTQFLKHEIWHLIDMLKASNITPSMMFFPTKKNSGEYLGCNPKSHSIWASYKAKTRADKPGTAIVDHIRDINPNASNFWIVGDGHTQKLSDDWDLARACEVKYPDDRFYYVPVEMLEIAVKLLS